MISFRYHLVTLIAVFFALAIGIVTGTSVAPQGLIRTLEGQRNILQGIKDDLFDENNGLRAEVALWEGFGDGLLLPALEGRLNGLDVTLVLPPFTPDPFRVELRSTLRTAGARVDGEVRLGPRLLLEDETAAEQLALAIDAGTRRGDDLLRATGTWLGERSGVALLDGLSDGPFEQGDFVEIAERRSGTSSRHATLIAWDATDENSPLAGSLMPSLLAAAAETSEPVALAEALAQEPSVATTVRDTDALRIEIATVDHAGTTLGAVALAAAIAEVSDTPPTVEHFGVLPGAAGVLPEGAFEATTPKEPRPSSSPKARPRPSGTAGTP
jgi:hypothetical protein